MKTIVFVFIFVFIFVLLLSSLPALSQEPSGATIPIPITTMLPHLDAQLAIFCDAGVLRTWQYQPGRWLVYCEVPTTTPTRRPFPTMTPIPTAVTWFTPTPTPKYKLFVPFVEK